MPSPLPTQAESRTRVISYNLPTETFLQLLSQDLPSQLPNLQVLSASSFLLRVKLSPLACILGGCFSQPLATNRDVNSELREGPPAEDLCGVNRLSFFTDLIHRNSPLPVPVVPCQLARRNDLVLMKINGLEPSHKSQGAGGLGYKYLPGRGAGRGGWSHRAPLCAGAHGSTPLGAPGTWWALRSRTGAWVSKSQGPMPRPLGRRRGQPRWLPASFPLPLITSSWLGLREVWLPQQ